MNMFTAEEAFKQGQVDMARAVGLVEWMRKSIGPMTAEQEEEFKALVLSARYAEHVRQGRLAPHS